MCLDTVDKEIKVARKTGYKVVELVKGSLFSPLREAVYKAGEWIEDERIRPIPIRREKNYPAGFHVFITLKGLQRWWASPLRGMLSGYQIRKVEFDDVVATGKQDGVKVIVARKIKIGDEVK